MNWEEKIKKLEETSLQEIELKIIEHNNKVNEAALTALSEIHWVLKTNDSDKEAIKKITEIQEKFHSLSVSGLKFHIDKIQKEKLMEDPNGFRDTMKSLSEFAESLKEDKENKE